MTDFRCRARERPTIRIVLAIVAVLWSLGASLAAAQEAAKDGTTYLQPKDNYRIFALGDALAAGLGSGLTRLAEGDQRITVDGRYKEDSGLARPEFYDWNAALPKIFESNDIDIAVILIGANDTHDIRDGSLRHAFATQEWTNAYVAQIDRLAASLKQAGAAVYWVELPPMQAAIYDAAIRALSIVQRERSRALGIRFVETAKALAGRDGGYRDIGLDSSGENRRLRDRDGVHFLKAGNNKLASLVLAAIRADIEAADKAAAGGSATASASAGPVFGQVPAAGVANTIQTDLPSPEAAAGQALTEPVAREPKTVAERAAPGSAAEKLFKLGEAPAAPPGRFDDFAFSAPSAR